MTGFGYGMDIKSERVEAKITPESWKEQVWWEKPRVKFWTHWKS